MLNTELNLPTASPEDAFAARLQQVFHLAEHALWDPDVRQACDAFATEQSLYQGRALPGGSTGFYVFERKASHA